MTIVDELKKLIASRGGNPAGVMTIADAIRVLNDLEQNSEEPSDGEETP